MSTQPQLDTNYGLPRGPRSPRKPRTSATPFDRSDSSCHYNCIAQHLSRNGKLKVAMKLQSRSKVHQFIMSPRPANSFLSRPAPPSKSLHRQLHRNRSWMPDVTRPASNHGAFSSSRRGRPAAALCRGNRVEVQNAGSQVLPERRQPQFLFFFLS